MKASIEGLAAIAVAIAANYGLAIFYDAIDEAIFEDLALKYPVYVEAGKFVVNAIGNGKSLINHVSLVFKSFFAIFGAGSFAEFILAVALAGSMIVVASIYTLFALFIIVVAVFGNILIFFF